MLRNDVHLALGGEVGVAVGLAGRNGSGTYVCTLGEESILLLCVTCCCSVHPVLMLGWVAGAGNPIYFVFVVLSYFYISHSVIRSLLN